MMVRPFTRIDVHEPSQVGEARRAAARESAAAGLNETEAGRVAIVVTELANNLVRHAKSGEILLRSTPGQIDLFAIDRGPGIADVARCMADGYSTGGTAGQGLGAVRRLSTTFDLHSTVSSGTAIACRLRSASADAPSQDEQRFACICVPTRHETACGDAANITAMQDGSLWILVADGLGHGPLAAEASAEASSAFDATPHAAPAGALEIIHGRLRSTRGAAAAVARLDLPANTLRYAAVGNIAGSLVTPTDSRGLFSHNGTVGHQVRKIQEFDYPLPPAGLLVMHSDGLGSRWNLSDYPGLILRDPSLVAAVLYRDFVRGRDDVTILVARLRPSGA